VWGEVKGHFRPEFLNRIDETVVFHALGREHIEAIAKIQLKVLEARLDKLEMKLEVSPAALAETGQGRLRPGVRRTAAEARASSAHREPGGQADPAGPLRPEGRDSGGRRGRRVHVWPRGALTTRLMR
jgi:hypothetical protein